MSDITSFGKLLEWAGVSQDDAYWAALFKSLGGPSTFADIAGIAPAEWDEYLSGLRYDRPETHPSGEGEGQPLTPVERSRLRRLWAGARACLGLSTSTAAGSASGQSNSEAQAKSAAVKKIKLSSILDPTAEAEVAPLDASTVRQVFRDYEVLHGAPPREDAEPTIDQLSAVHQVVSAGFAPYVDFAIFGPHGRRLLRKLTFIDHVFLPETGGWRRVELPGPPDFEAWLRSWGVFECTLLLLKQVRGERLRAYQELLRGFVLHFGQQCWPIIYQADVRLRSEHLERTRRQVEIASGDGGAQGPGQYDPALPWDFIFAAILRDKEFWDREVREKCLLFLTRVQTQAAVLSDGTALDISPAAIAPAPALGGKGSGQGPRKRPPASSGSAPGPRAKSKGTKGSGKANEICQNFNRGVCTKTQCPNGRRHVCSHCGGDHQVKDCPTAPAPPPPKGSGAKGSGKNPKKK